MVVGGCNNPTPQRGIGKNRPSSWVVGPATHGHHMTRIRGNIDGKGQVQGRSPYVAGTHCCSGKIGQII